MAKRPKNILFLWTDQQRPDTIGAYGNTQIQTPNLDRLAAGAALFEQAYCAQPTCSPSRASVLTGLYPHTHGVLPWGSGTKGIRLSPNFPTLAELLRPVGYTCGYVGKWHLGNESGRVPPGRRGFDDFWASTEDRYTGDHAAAGYGAYHHFLLSRGYKPSDGRAGGPVFSRNETVRLPEAASKPAFQAGECIRFLETHRERPFLLSCNFSEPHHPYFGPFNDRYRPDEMVLPESWYRAPEATVPLRFRLRRQAYVEGLGHELPGDVTTSDVDRWQTLKARYWGSCTLVDKYAGQILARLEEVGLAEDTIVVYTTDHGDMMGEHHMLQKAMPYEGASHVPLLVRVPGMPARRVETPANLVQLVPTLLDLLGQPLPRHLQGTSLRPLLEAGDTAPDEAEVVIEWNGPFGIQNVDELRRRGYLSGIDPADPRLTVAEVRTIRRGRWKLNVHASGEHELYDLEAEPGELHNAFYDAGVEAVIATLDQRLRRWQRETDDRLALPDVLDVRQAHGKERWR